MLHFATYFDRHYLPRGVALHQSLIRHSPPFVLWILCLDEQVERALEALDLDHVRIIPLAELEEADPSLLDVKSARQPIEYYWTCGPAWLRHLLLRDPEIQSLTYLDADMFFFSSPAPLYAALADGPILLREQRPWQTGGDPPRGGRYNVGCLVFRRTAAALACLDHWRERCLEWCFDRFEPGRHGDQRYLDDWPEQFGAIVGRHAGIGLAPWHIGQLPVAYKDGEVTVDHDPLICYHFARVRRVSRWLYELHDTMFHDTPVSALVRRHIYAPYLRALHDAERQIHQANGRIHSGTARTITPGELMRRARKSHAAATSHPAWHRFMFVNRWLVV